MFSDCNSLTSDRLQPNYLFDEVIQILWDFRSETTRFEDTEDFISGDETNLGDSMRVTQYDTDLGGSHSSAGEFVDLVDDFCRGSFEPRRSTTGVRESRGRNALAWSVHTT